MKDKKIEPEPLQGNRNPVPIQCRGIGTRISEAAELVGTRKIAASVMGVSPDTLQRYIREEVEPSLGPVVALAKAAGISLVWLTTGSLPMRPEEAPPAPQGTWDPELLRDAVEALEEVLEEEDIDLSPSKKAEAIILLYEMEQESAATGQKPDKQRILRLVRLAA